MAQTNEELRKKMAVALSYEPEEGAPKIVASGEGYVAQKMPRQMMCRFMRIPSLQKPC